MLNFLFRLGSTAALAAMTVGDAGAAIAALGGLVGRLVELRMVVRIVPDLSIDIESVRDWAVACVGVPADRKDGPPPPARMLRRMVYRPSALALFRARRSRLKLLSLADESARSRGGGEVRGVAVARDACLGLYVRPDAAREPASLTAAKLDSIAGRA